MGGAPVSNGGNSAGGNATNGGESNTACAEFNDAPSAGTVAIIISNQTSQTIHVGTTEPISCGNPPLFRVADATGEDLPAVAFCRNACSWAMQEDPIGGCLAICLFPQAVKLEPFEATTVTWEAYMEELSLPEECSITGESVMCDRTRRIDPGTYTFSASAGTELDCSETLGDCGECMAQSLGGCTQPGRVSGTLFTATTTVQLDEAYGISSSNANNANFAAPAPGATAPVELIFTDP
jgi:hypothetical protein